MSVGSKVLIAGSFVLFGLSLLLSALAMFAFFQRLDVEDPQRIKRSTRGCYELAQD